MPHDVWNLGDQPASVRVQERTFTAGVRPAQGIVIRRGREPKPMIRIVDAWLEVNDFDVATEDFHQIKMSLALGSDPLNVAQLLPVGRVSFASDGTNNPDAAPLVEQLFRAQGTLWAAEFIAIDVQEAGAVVLSDIDVHMDWGAAVVDWFTWFVGWNNLEASPDGNLVDGDRTYA